MAILDWVLINNTPHKIQAIDSIDAEILADDELYYVGEDGFICDDAWNVVHIVNGYEVRFINKAFIPV